MRLFVGVFPPPPCGERLASLVAGLRAALGRACAAVAPFRAAFGEAGAFDSWQRPKILWLGLSEGAQAMTKLAQAVRAELEAGVKSAQLAEMSVEAAELISSRTDSSGPVYTSVRRESLCGK